MMRLYKIKMCTRTTPHNWKLCPWAHPGETAALRRDPSTHVAEMCPAVRQVSIDPRVAAANDQYLAHTFALSSC